MSDQATPSYADADDAGVRAARQRFVERAADMIPSLFDSLTAGDRDPKYLLGERTIDGRVARLTLRVSFVTGVR